MFRDRFWSPSGVDFGVEFGVPCEVILDSFWTRKVWTRKVWTRKFWTRKVWTRKFWTLSTVLLIDMFWAMSSLWIVLDPFSQVSDGDNAILILRRLSFIKRDLFCLRHS